MKRALLVSFLLISYCTNLYAQAISVAFSADKQAVCPGDSVRFTPIITGAFTSVLWSFPGGSPSSSTALNPKIGYNTPGVYSVTLTAKSATDSATKTGVAFITVSQGQVQAVNEGFQGATFPPTGWQLAKTSTNDWALNTTVGGFGTSTRSIVYNNYTFNALGKRDRIMAPKMDLRGVGAAILTFDVAYAPYMTGYPDSLQVRVSTDCGNTWTVVYSKTGTALATAPAFTAGTFVPTATQWRKETISLTPYVNNTVLVSFDNIGYFGQAIYIDNVNILPSPLVAFTAQDTAACVNTPIQFMDGSVNATNWLWSFPGGTPSTATSPVATVVYSTPGDYTATLTASNTTGSNSITKTNYIHITTKPTVTITRTGFLLNAIGTSNSYQWYLNNVAIPGATSATLLAGTTGTYKVAVSKGGCSDTTASFYYVLLGVDKTAGLEGISIFPNPTNGIVTVKTDGMSTREVAVQCYNTAGQVVRSEVIKLTGTTNTATFDWSSLPKGMYQLRLTSDKGKSMHSNLILQ